MILKNNFFFFKSALTERQCNNIITVGLSKMEIAKDKDGDKAISAATFDNKEKGGINKEGKKTTDEKMLGHLTRQGARKKGLKENDVYVRDSHVSWIGEKWIFDMIHPFVQEANQRAGWNYQWDFSEPAQFTKYGPGQFYGWHSDSGPDPYKMALKGVDGKLKIAIKNDLGWVATDKNAPLRKDGNLAPGWVTQAQMAHKIRKLSVTVNLTTPGNYEGGNLKFDLGPHAPKRYHVCKEIRPRGTIIVFPSHLYHQVTPVTKGTRYSLVMWNLGHPFR